LPICSVCPVDIVGAHNLHLVPGFEQRIRLFDQARVN
jgi:hypothetical protein